MKKTLSIVIFPLLLLNGCAEKSAQPEKTIYFEQDVLPVFQSNCTQAGCHNATDKAEGYVLTSYETIRTSGKGRGIVPFNYKKSSIYQSLIAAGPDLMPANPYKPLNDNQIATIALWIKQGALNNATQTTANLENVTYGASVKPILDNYCKACHSAGNSISFDSYPDTKVTASNGQLLGSIKQISNYSAMPPTGKLSDMQIAIIERWITNGCPNN